MTVTAAPPAMTPRSAGPGVTPSFILRYMDRPVSYDAKPSPFETVLLNCACQHSLCYRAALERSQALHVPICTAAQHDGPSKEGTCRLHCRNRLWGKDRKASTEKFRGSCVPVR